MNNNVAIQNLPVTAWTGAAGIARDITKFTRFAWAAEVIGVIAADAIFEIQSAPPSADPCVAGAFAAIPETVICDRPIIPAVNTRFTIPAGTPIGTICTFTIPCRPNRFLKIVAVSGTNANVLIGMVLSGPMQ